MHLGPPSHRATIPLLTLATLLVSAPATPQVWTPLGPTEGPVVSLDAQPAAGGRLLAASGGTLYLSEDEGASWTPVLSGGIWEVAVSPVDPSRAYALAQDEIVYRSGDGGLTWEENLELEDHVLFDAWTDPVDPEVAYFTSQFIIQFSEDPTALYRTADGGETWEQVWFGGEIFVVDVGFGFGFESTHLLTTSAGVLQRSEDDGLTWATVDATGLEGADLCEIAGDPTTPGRFLASPCGGGLFETTDAGDSWHPYGLGLPGGSFLRLLFEPTSPTTVYAAAAGHGVFRSLDGGATWAPVGTGAPTDRLEGALDLAPTGDPLRLFAATDQGVQIADPAAVPPCVAGPATLCLQAGRFEARVAWQDFQGGAGEGRAVPLTGDTGAFWFFRDTNLELAVKVLDGTPVNGFFWNFYGSLSNVPFTLTVRDSVTGEQRFYINPSRVFASRGDTRGFPQNPAPAGEAMLSAGAPVALGGDLGTIGAGTGIESVLGAGGTGGDCVPSDTALCLQDGRFRIEVEWQDFQGGSGVGHGHPLTGDTGAFWFFDQDNLELFVKVLDGRPVNGHFWVFYGSLSNVAFTLTVTDTATGEPRVYENPARTFASRGDTAAF